MTFRDGLIVEASHHAIDAATRRVAVVKGADRRGVERWVERTAARGLEAQRFSQTVPRWATRTRKRVGIGIRGKSRFVWNEDETTLFLCVRAKMHRIRRGEREDLGYGWLVVTVIARPRDDVSSRQ